MTITALILARMSSRRLPGKVLRDVAGRPMLERVVARARRIASATEVVVATSRDASDDPIARHCDRLGVPVFRGSLDDVSHRVLDCALSRRADCFARINADSPFIDPTLIDTALTQAVDQDLDLATNLQPRSFPCGVTVEVFATRAYRWAYGRMTRAEDFEHVSAFFYRNLDDFRYANLSMPGDNCSDIRLTVDDQSDLERASRLIEHLGERYEVADTAEIVAAHRELFPINQPVCAEVRQ